MTERNIESIEHILFSKGLDTPTESKKATAENEAGGGQRRKGRAADVNCRCRKDAQHSAPLD